MELGLLFRTFFVIGGFVIFMLLMHLITTHQFGFNDLGLVVFNFLFWYYPIKKAVKG